MIRAFSKFAFPLAALGLAALGSATNVPTFSATATDGKTYTAQSFIQRPTIIVFLMDGCPSNKAGVPLVNDLAAQLKGKVDVVGIMDSDLASVRKQVAEHSIQFPVIADPQKTIIKGFGAKRSFDLTGVGSKRQAVFTKIWEGTSRQSATEILNIIRGYGHSVPSVNWSKWPQSMVRGCML